MNPNIVEWGVAAKQMPGESISGDLHLVKPVDHGVLVVVADGLGHGKAAAEAAELAINVAADCAYDPLIRMLEHCNQRLRRTRGAVMSLAFFNILDNTMTWLGVGNVEGVLIRSTSQGEQARETLALSPGVVGVRIPRLRASILPVSPRDTLIFATDGIRPGFEETVNLSQTPRATAQGILARDGLETDDALVLVANYKGRPQ